MGRSESLRQGEAASEDVARERIVPVLRSLGGVPQMAFQEEAADMEMQPGVIGNAERKEVAAATAAIKNSGQQLLTAAFFN